MAKNQERITLPSTTSDRQGVRSQRQKCIQIKGVKIGAKKKALITSRSFPREIPVLRRFFERRFQPLSVGGFFSNQRESISWCPKSPFTSKTQNRQIARTSPLTLSDALRQCLELKQVSPFAAYWLLSCEQRRLPCHVSCMHLPNCHPRHRALRLDLRLDELRYSRAISGRSLLQWLPPRGKA